MPPVITPGLQLCRDAGAAEPGTARSPASRSGTRTTNTRSSFTAPTGPGQPLSHTCDPRQLGTYFDKDGARLHYLTPIYFKREVLQPYAAEPGKYALSATRLSCLSLWGTALKFADF